VTLNDFYTGDPKAIDTTVKNVVTRASPGIFKLLQHAFIHFSETRPRDSVVRTRSSPLKVTDSNNREKK
jgi:hypothetical protein